jgi:hypothetical protein
VAEYERGRQTEAAYFRRRNQKAPNEPHTSTEISTEAAMSFIHSKVGTVHFPIGIFAAPLRRSRIGKR